MTDKEYEEKKIKLNMYRDTVRKLARRQEELQRLQDLSVRSTVGVFSGRSGAGQPKDQLGSVASTAIGLHEECKKIEVQVVQLRQELCRCIAMVPESNHKEMLESVYLVGKSMEQIADERTVTVKTVRRWSRAAVIGLGKSSDFFGGCP